MSGPVWSLKYVVSGTEYTISNIISCSYNYGRLWPTDPYSTGTATIVCRNITAWPTPNPAMGRTAYLSMSNSLSGPGAFIGFAGFISDISIEYGMTANMDIATITLEGSLAAVGRNNLTSQAFSQQATSNYADAVFTATGTNGLGYYGTSIASAQTYTGNALDLLNELALTEVGRLAEVYFTNSVAGAIPAIMFLGRNVLGYQYTNPFIFTDVPADPATSIRYSRLDFKSAAENYYTKVTIAPQGLARQSEGTGNRVLFQDSLDYTTLQADNHASYLLANYGKQKITPYSITFDYESQSSSTTKASFEQSIANFVYYNVPAVSYTLRMTVGTLIEIKFRGTTYKAVVEGLQVSADPSNTTVTLLFSPQDTNAYLKWTSPSPYNTWDNNKWGF